MRKILSLALVIVMCFSLFAIPSFAMNDAILNPEVDIEFTSVAPKVDGVVDSGEYGLKIHSVDYNNKEFSDDRDENHSINSDFYACWDKDNLYLAWVVTSELDEHFAPDKDANMWEHCCVQFILTSSAPKMGETNFQTAQWSGDYLEVGLCVADDGDPVKCCWSKPLTADALLSPDDWDFMGSVLVDGKTTYECRIPWTKSGVLTVGDDVQIGFGYSVGDQEDFTNVEENIVEWPDVLLTNDTGAANNGKVADGCAVFTLVGEGSGQIIEVSQDSSQGAVEKNKIEYTLPANAVTCNPEAINASITTGLQSIITDTANLKDYNLKWTANLLLAPTDDKTVYTLVEKLQGSGDETPAFTSEIKEGYIVLALHGDDSTDSNSESCQLRNKWMECEVGAKVTFLGYDFVAGNVPASNPVVYYEGTAPEVSDDTSADASTDTSADASTDTSADASTDASTDTSADASTDASTDASADASTDASADASKDASADASKEASTTPGTDDNNKGSDLTWLWIVIGVLVVAAVVVVVIVIKKKKN